MGLLFSDSFDHYADANKTMKWTQYVSTGTGTGGAGAGSSTITAATGARSTQSLRLAVSGAPATFTGSGSLNKVLTTSGATIVAGFRYRCVTTFAIQYQGTNSENYTGDNSCLFACRSGSTTQWWLQLNTNGTIDVYRGSTLLGTTTSALTQNTFTYIEVKVVLNGATGTVDVRFDGTSVLALTGKNTQNAGVSTWDEVRFGPVTAAVGDGSASNGAKTWDFDDFYLLDGSGATSTTFLGDVRVDAAVVTAAGDETNWTPDSGSNYARVAEVLVDSDTSYVTASTTGTIDTYKTATQPVAGATIYGIQFNIMAKKTDAGTATVKPVVRIASADFLGNSLTPTTGYTDLIQTYDLNPSTGVAWVDGDIGPTATQFGIDKAT